jgi:Protein of unknown function (DUF3486)
MGIRSKIETLPAAVRAELDRLIVERAFSGYKALAEWLQAQGYRIADDSVQRYGVRLRRQLKALELTRHHAQALAAAGGGDAGTVDALTAITVQQIQHQVLSILLQAAEPESSGETRTATDTIGAGPADSEEYGKERGGRSPSVSAGGEVKTLELGDLVRLTRITVGLNRIMDAQRMRAEQLGEQSRQPRANQPASQPKSRRPSEEVSRTMLNALLAIHSIAPTETPASPPLETTATPTKSVSNHSMPANAQPSAPESRPPQLTAPDRTSPHRKDRPIRGIYEHPLGLALSCRPEASFPLTSGRR